MTTVIFPKQIEGSALPGQKVEPKAPVDAAPSSGIDKRPSGLSPTQPASTVHPPASPSLSHTSDAQYRTLSHSEWIQFCQGVGVLRDDESKSIVRATSVTWPPKGFPGGLYRDVLSEKAKFSYWFHILSVTRYVVWEHDLVPFDLL
ncbi:hypothetical protein BX600DRAFT_446030 [Xylariales sp. PMI_506]|nr:hypothetical protein BX600DRAFT_446030 [Xylariales sp. PMI_506]